MPRRRTSRALWVAWLSLGAMWGAGSIPGARAQAAEDELLSAVTKAKASDAVDVAALAKLTARASGVLSDDQAGIERVQQLIRVPEALEEQVTRRLEAYFDIYGQSLREFRREAVAFEREPGSRAALFRTLMAGQRTCWNLDLYHQQIQTWGSGVADLRSLQPSREACGRFRTAAFHPAVLALVEEALAGNASQAEEIRRLKDETAELERLVRDLVEIDAAP